jgi:hypothetical protein
LFKRFRRWLAHIILAVGTFVTGSEYVTDEDGRVRVCIEPNGVKRYYDKDGSLTRVQYKYYTELYDDKGHCNGVIFYQKDDL